MDERADSHHQAVALGKAVAGFKSAKQSAEYPYHQEHAATYPRQSRRSGRYTGRRKRTPASSPSLRLGEPGTGFRNLFFHPPVRPCHRLCQFGTFAKETALLSVGKRFRQSADTLISFFAHLHRGEWSQHALSRSRTAEMVRNSVQRASTVCTDIGRT